jgi:transposase InsO family protein
MALKSRQGDHAVQMESYYRYVGVSRQAVHKGMAAQKKKEESMDKMKHQITEYRMHKDRRAGSRSLYYNLGIKEEYNIGVTKFEKLLSANGLTLSPLHVRIITTRSVLSSRSYPNLTDGLEVMDINQLVVGDLTYIGYGKHRMYLFCLTDVYSGHIVGRCVSARMRSIEAEAAFERWVSLRGKEAVKGCIHHTDGGAQYFSAAYINAVRTLGIKISVATNCIENGYAEQRNGYIKHHLLPTIGSCTQAEFVKELERIIDSSNSDRKQARLKWRSPIEYEKYISTLDVKPKLLLHDFRK